RTPGRDRRKLAVGRFAALSISAFALSQRPEYWLGFLPAMTARAAPLTTRWSWTPRPATWVARGRVKMHPRGSAVSSRSPRGFSFGSTSASSLASVAFIEVYRRVMRISAALDAPPNWRHWPGSAMIHRAWSGELSPAPARGAATYASHETTRVLLNTSSVDPHASFR